MKSQSIIQRNIKLRNYDESNNVWKQSLTNQKCWDIRPLSIEKFKLKDYNTKKIT